MRPVQRGVISGAVSLACFLACFGGFLFLRVEGWLFLGFLVALSDLVHGRAPDADRRMSAPPHYRPLGSRKPARGDDCFAGVAPRSDATLRYRRPQSVQIVRSNCRRLALELCHVLGQRQGVTGSLQRKPGLMACRSTKLGMLEHGQGAQGLLQPDADRERAGAGFGDRREASSNRSSTASAGMKTWG